MISSRSSHGGYKSKREEVVRPGQGQKSLHLEETMKICHHHCTASTQFLIYGGSQHCHCFRVNCSARMAGSTAPAVFDDLILHIAPDKFYLESLSSTQSVLVIDRITYEISLQVNLKTKYIFFLKKG